MICKPRISYCRRSERHTKTSSSPQILSFRSGLYAAKATTALPQEIGHKNQTYRQWSGAIENLLKLLTVMGCGVSKDDIAEPRPMRSDGRSHKFQFVSKAALKPNILETYALDSTYVSLLHIPSSGINNPPPTSVFINTPDEDTSVENESYLDPSFAFPFKMRVEEVNDNTPNTTALAALSGEKEAKTSKTEEKDKTNENVHKRIETIFIHDEALSTERCEDCSTCPLDMLSEAAILQDLRNTSPGEESDAGITRWLESTYEKEVYQSDQEQKLEGIKESEDFQEPAEPNEPAELDVVNHEKEHADEVSAAFLTENSKQQEKHMQHEQLKRQDQIPDDSADANKIWSGSEFKKTKLPPLAIVSSTLIEIPSNPFTKPALPTSTKHGFLEVEVPTVCETEKYEDHSAGTVTMVLEPAESINGDNSDESSTITEHSEGTPTPATKSPTRCEWRTPLCDLPD